jgi:hypothetical protein
MLQWLPRDRRAAGDGVRLQGNCEPRVEEAAWQGSRVHLHRGPGETTCRAGNRLILAAVV